MGRVSSSNKKSKYLQRTSFMEYFTFGVALPHEDECPGENARILFFLPCLFYALMSPTPYVLFVSAARARTSKMNFSKNHTCFKKIWFDLVQRELQ